MNTLRLPIRFKKDSLEMEAILEDTDEYFANLIGITVQILPGSLPISTFYGVEDPTFESAAIAKVGLKLRDLISDVEILNSSAEPNNDGTTNLKIQFSRRT